MAYKYFSAIKRKISSLGFMRCRKLLILARVKFPFRQISRFNLKREIRAKGNLKREKSPKGNLKAKTGKSGTQRAQKQKREFKPKTGIYAKREFS